MITVRAKITAGHHPDHGAIIKGQLYHIRADQFADQLFELAAPSAVAEAMADKPLSKSKK